MMRKHWVLLVLLSIASNLMAQKLIIPTDVRGTAELSHGVGFGVKGGMNLPRLYYTDPNLKDLPHDFIFGVSGGLYVEFPLFKVISVAPELNYQMRGGSTTYIYELSHKVNYQLQADYASLRVPVLCYVPLSHTVNPYLFVGPDLGYALRGKITLTQKDLAIPGSEVALSDANISRIYAGVIGGAGIRFDLPFWSFTMVIKADAAINLGLSDTYAPKEHQGTANATNVNAYNIVGKRFSRGMEFHLSIGFIRADNAGLPMH